MTTTSDNAFTQGFLHFKAKEWEKAIPYFQAVLAEDLDEPEALRHMAICLAELHRYEEALEAIRMAIGFSPLHGGAYNCLHAVVGQLGRHPEAHDAAKRAIELLPYSPPARWNYALSCLKMGELAEGFANYKWGQINGTRPRRTLEPAWEGGYAGYDQTIFVWTEQGAGDTIQFSRFLHPLKQMGWGKVVFEVKKSLLPLMQGVEGPDLVVASSPDYNIPVHFDAHVSLMDLPGIFGYEEPADIKRGMKGTLTIHPEVLKGSKEFLDNDADGKLKIGLCTKGSKNHANDFHRSIHQDVSFGIAEGFSDKCAFYDFTEGSKDSSLVKTLTPACASWVQTAGLVSNLDLLITVDTAIAHLAGTLGVSTLLMLPFSSEWRWFRPLEARTESRETVWYPSTVISQCTERDNWANVLMEVRDALRSI